MGAAAAVVVCLAWPGAGRSGALVDAGPAPAPGVSQALDVSADPAWQTLVARVKKLEDSARLVPVVHSATEPRRSAELNPIEIEAILERLEELERAKAARGSAAGPLPTDVNDVHWPDDEAETRGLASAVILDRGASDEAKIDAHKRLRRLEDPYTDAMLDELLRIAESSPDEELRGNVWTYFDGTAHLPDLVPRLMNAARNDPSAAVRTEAVETLGNYLDDPSVRALLESILRDDPDKSVRDRARRTLREGG